MRALALIALLAACDTAPEAPAEPAPAPEAAPAASAHADAAPATAEALAGTVLETLDAAGYTYVHVKTEAGEEIWAAVPQTTLAVGEAVVVPTDMPMADFHSEALGRDFPVIFFAGSVKPGASAPAPRPLPAAPETADAGPAEGERTVEALFAERAALAGKRILVQGTVTKSTAAVMGRNWLHLEDGTGAEGSSDLTITTTDSAQVGDRVRVTGTVQVDQDFGYGYAYDLLLADAKVEPATP